MSTFGSKMSDSFRVPANYYRNSNSNDKGARSRGGTGTLYSERPFSAAIGSLKLSFEYVHDADNYYHSCDFKTIGATRARCGRVGAGENTDAKCNGVGHTSVKAITYHRCSSLLVRFGLSTQECPGTA